MPFQAPRVPSPTLSRSPPTSSTSPTSPPFAQHASSNLGNRNPPTTSASIGLGVLGAGELGESKSEGLEGKDVTSPVELTQFVDTLLNDLETRFDTLSSDVLSRLSSLSTRVDSLETSLADLMAGTTAPIPTTSNSTST